MGKSLRIALLLAIALSSRIWASTLSTNIVTVGDSKEYATKALAWSGELSSTEAPQFECHEGSEAGVNCFGSQSWVTAATNRYRWYVADHLRSDRLGQGLESDDIVMAVDYGWIDGFTITNQSGDQINCNSSGGHIIENCILRPHDWNDYGIELSVFTFGSLHVAPIVVRNCIITGTGRGYGIRMQCVASDLGSGATLPVEISNTLIYNTSNAIHTYTLCSGGFADLFLTNVNLITIGNINSYVETWGTCPRTFESNMWWYFDTDDLVPLVLVGPISNGTANEIWLDVDNNYFGLRGDAPVIGAGTNRYPTDIIGQSQDNNIGPYGGVGNLVNHAAIIISALWQHVGGLI